jgi:prophage regulatory protein
MRATGLSRSAVYQLVALGRFPSPRKLGVQSVAWRSDEVRAWIDTRPVSGSHE